MKVKMLKCDDLSNKSNKSGKAALIVGTCMAALMFLAVTGAPTTAQDKANPPVFDFKGLPPAMGPVEPRIMPKKGEDGLYRHDWFVGSFLNLRDDYSEARANGKRIVLIFEQRGCSYCKKLQTESLSAKYVNDYVRKHFDVVQINMWGDRDVTDFDGKVMSEKKLAARYNVLFTPTLVFIKDDLSGLKGKSGRALEVVRLNQVGMHTVYDIFTWVKHKVYEKQPSFQRFHIARINHRRAMRGEELGTDGKPLKNRKTH